MSELFKPTIKEEIRTKLENRKDDRDKRVEQYLTLERGLKSSDNPKEDLKTMKDLRQLIKADARQIESFLAILRYHGETYND
jgi:hypothetical protein